MTLLSDSWERLGLGKKLKFMSAIEILSRSFYCLFTFIIQKNTLHCTIFISCPILDVSAKEKYGEDCGWYAIINNTHFFYYYFLTAKAAN